MGLLSRLNETSATQKTATAATPPPVETLPKYFEETETEQNDRLAKTFFYIEATTQKNHDDLITPENKYKRFTKTEVVTAALNQLLHQKAAELGIDSPNHADPTLNRLAIQMFGPVFDQMDPELNQQSIDFITNPKETHFPSYIYILAKRITTPTDTHIQFSDLFPPVSPNDPNKSPENAMDIETNIAFRIINEQNHEKKTIQLPTEEEVVKSMALFNSENQT